MLKRFVWVGAAIILSSMLSSCGSEPSGGSSDQTSYKDMKTMVIDILKTEDAQKALQESAAASTGNTGMTSKLLSVQDQEQLKMAVKETLVSPEYDKVIEKLMTDPRFAGEFSKAVNKQNKQIHKDLLKDPAYQKDMIQAMKSNEMNKLILDVLQSTQYRKQVMTIMQESLQSPLFRLEILDLMKKAVHEELKPKPDEKVGKSKGGGGGGGGGEGGSGGEDSQEGDSKDQGEGSGMGEGGSS